MQKCRPITIQYANPTSICKYRIICFYWTSHQCKSVRDFKAWGTLTQRCQTNTGIMNNWIKNRTFHCFTQSCVFIISDGDFTVILSASCIVPPVGGDKRLSLWASQFESFKNNDSFMNATMFNLNAVVTDILENIYLIGLIKKMLWWAKTA